ncbi:NADPH-dependent FMN reductase [Nocardioides sp. LHG3406-4]|uniref:NADPH-dependent FMN reductase n=1 Tax=Nocardioides sp. LHG3406-4 TaxID=2804575 RepID=UPI003CED72D0
MSPHIGILVGSTRPGRKGSQIGRWVLDHASGRDDATFELVELADYDLPLLREAVVPGDANRDYETPQTRVWSQRIDTFDGFVWVTPEYNHGVPAAMKNALDVLYPEWGHKAVAFVSYGADAGVRAVEHWRAIVANVHMVDVRSQVALSTFGDFAGETFSPSERRPQELTRLLDQLTAMTTTMLGMRSRA